MSAGDSSVGGRDSDAAVATTGRGASGWPAARLRSGGILIPFLILFAILSISKSTFLTSSNLTDILDQQSATLIMAGAGTLVLISGGIDLSIGAVYSLAGVIAAQVGQHSPAGIAIAAGIGVGLLVGIVNGIVSTFLRINSLITTLAMSFVIGGVASLITGGNLISLFARPGFGDLARTDILGAKSSIWVMVLMVVVAGILLSRTAIGRYMYAVGGSMEAARLAGVRVNLIRITAFAFSGGAAALAGIIDVSRVLAAEATDQTTLAFTVLAGIVIGGTSILGGEGAVWRTVCGVLFIALVGNGFELLGLNPLYQQLALGVIMLFAVGIDVWTRQRRT
jgi:ribose transport system permease protein